MPRDILVKVDNEEVKTLAEVKRLHQKLTQAGAGKNRVVLTVLRNGLLRQIVLDFREILERNKP